MNIWPPPSTGDYAPPPPASHPALDLAGRLDAILNTLTILIASRFRIFGDLTPWLCNRIGRARRRLVNALALLAAGRASTPPVPAARVAPRVVISPTVAPGWSSPWATPPPPTPPISSSCCAIPPP